MVLGAPEHRDGSAPRGSSRPQPEPPELSRSARSPAGGGLGWGRWGRSRPRDRSEAGGGRSDAEATRVRPNLVLVDWLGWAGAPRLPAPVPSGPLAVELGERASQPASRQPRQAAAAVSRPAPRPASAPAAAAVLCCVCQSVVRVPWSPGARWSWSGSGLSGVVPARSRCAEGPNPRTPRSAAQPTVPTCAAATDQIRQLSSPAQGALVKASRSPCLTLDYCRAGVIASVSVCVCVIKPGVTDTKCSAKCDVQ